MPFAATRMELETLILSKVLERERQIPRGIAYVETKIWHKLTYTQSSNGLTDMENRLVVAKRKGEGVGGTGNLGLIDANYCLWNG